MERKKRIRTWGMTVLLVSAAAGCAAERPFPPGEVLGAGEGPPAVGSFSSDGAVASRERADLTGTFSIETVLGEAEAFNPVLAAVEARRRGRYHAADAAGRRPDLQLEYAHAIDPVQTRSGPMEDRFRLMQGIPFPGKLAAERRVAEAVARMSDREVDAARLRVLRQAAEAYFDLEYVHAALETNERDRELLAGFERIARSKYAGGEVTQQDVLKAQVAMLHVDHRRFTLEGERSRIEGRLNEILGRDAHEPLGRPAGVDAARFEGTLDDLAAAAVLRRPELLAYESMLAAAAARIDRAALDRYPDFGLGLEYNRIDADNPMFRHDGEDAFGVGASLRIPIDRRRIAARIREAESEFERVLAARETARLEVLREVRGRLASVEEAERIAALYAGDLVPRARQTVEAAEAGYRAGRVDFLTLLDGWKELLEVELALHRSRADFRKGVAALEQAVGMSLARRLHEE